MVKATTPTPYLEGPGSKRRSTQVENTNLNFKPALK